MNRQRQWTTSKAAVPRLLRNFKPQMRMTSFKMFLCRLEATPSELTRVHLHVRRMVESLRTSNLVGTIIYSSSLHCTLRRIRQRQRP